MLDPDHPIAELLQRDKRYRFDAYVFVIEALRFAHEKLGMGSEQPSEDTDLESLAQESDETPDEPERHVTGQELCEAMRVYAHEHYGYLAKSVLNHWGIKSTLDFGNIVFSLIEIGQMRKTTEDRLEDFEDVFDFDKGFQHSFDFSPSDATE